MQAKSNGFSCVSAMFSFSNRLDAAEHRIIHHPTAAAAGAAQVQHQDGRANAVHAAGSAAVFLPLLAVPASAALKLAEKLLILHVAWFHARGLSGVFHGLRVVVQAALRQRAEEIPAGVPLSGGYAAQRVERLGIVAGVDVVLRRAHLDGIILPRLAISAVARVAVGISAVSAPKRGKRVVILRLALLLRAAVIAAARALAAALPAVHDLLIRLLNFHEFLFGLLGELYVWKKDVYERDLRELGFYLGKFIYLCDSFEDVEQDIKKKNYNPLVERFERPEFEAESRMMLEDMMARACRAFECLPLLEDAPIMRNILYSGIWLRFEGACERRKAKSKQ